MSPTPSTILTDALASFNKAANLAFTTAQDQARKDVTQATADTREARRERDEAVKDLHACRVEEQAWKQEASVWKAAADQAELTIKHHLETITQLRQEATQWKDQCLRLEETSRQEAISWKEQFLRVEQERCKLAQRIDELLAEQLTGNQTQVSTTPFTPMLRYSGVGDLSASTRLQQLPAHESLLLDADETSTRPTSSKSNPSSSTRKPRQVPIVQLPTPISENQRVARQRAPQPASSSRPASRPGTTGGERQVLIRRVQAVVEVPVKEESADDEISELATSASASASTSSTSASASASASKTSSKVAQTAKAGKAATRIKRVAVRKASTKRPYVEIDDEDSTEESEESEASEQSDKGHESDDDELMLGAEDNRKEIYGIQRITKTSVPPKTPSHVSQTAKKRKLAVSATERKKSRPSAKSRV